MNPRFAILVDGAFLVKTLSRKLKAFPTVAQVDAECARIRNHADLRQLDLLRIYYYDAPPVSDTLTNPIDGTVLDLANSPVFIRNTQFLNDVEVLPNFAVRRGEAVARGWKIGKNALRKLLKNPASPQASDLQPNIQQKGVDLRIGLDIARLSLRQLVQVIVVVTGDSDLMPAFKFARREGMRVYLDHMGAPIRPVLKAHADVII
jgi:hypothetical protein